MAKPDSEFITYLKDALASFEFDAFRPMFGGYGIYKYGLVFAIVADNELYFKGDDASAHFYESAGSHKFTFLHNGKTMSMKYWLVSSDIIEDEEMLMQWCDVSYSAAQRAAINKKPKKKRKLNTVRFVTKP